MARNRGGGAAADLGGRASRLAHVVKRLEERGVVERFPCAQNGRATKARLTAPGRAEVCAAAPGHVAAVREHVIDPRTTAMTGPRRGAQGRPTGFEGDGTLPRSASPPP